MNELRAKILQAGIDTIREYGYAGFTQNRVAAKAGVRQSHLTYYHPTRSDLLFAVGQAAVEQQLRMIDAIFPGLTSPDEVARAIASVVTRDENTHVILALSQAGREYPAMSELFQTLAAGIIAQAAGFLKRAGYVGDPQKAALTIHALAVGLAVVAFATRRPNGTQISTDVVEFALRAMLASGDSAD